MIVIENIFLVTTTVLLFQITRNISMVGYVGILLMAYLCLYIVYFHKRGNVAPSLLGGVFLLTLLWIPVISLAHMDPSKYLIAFTRYCITLPFVFFMFIYNQYSFSLVTRVLRVLCVYMACAALSIPYQIMFGPISFFAESSFRDGLVRYASLAGSLTALGTLGSFALAILLFSGDLLFSRRNKNFLIAIILTGMLMSLQKAAVVNIIICFAAFVLMNDQISFSRKISVIVGIFLIAFVLDLMFDDSPFSIYVQSLFDYTFSETSVGVSQDLASRLWHRPQSVVNYHKIRLSSVVLGIGFPALGGILGLAHLPMSHNNYFDLLFSGGIIHFLSFLLLLGKVIIGTVRKRLAQSRLNQIDRAYFVVTLLIMGNMVIGAASFYQPISSVFTFWIICSYKRATDLLDKRSVS